MVTAQVNHCNSPIDVTFRITSVDPNDDTSDERGKDESSELSSNPQVQQFFRGLPPQNIKQAIGITTEKAPFKPKIDWKYTFVTTNQPESREIPGFYTGKNIESFCDVLKAKGIFVNLRRTVVKIPHIFRSRYK